MKRWIRYSLVVVLLSGLFFYVIVKGGRISRTLEAGQCKIRYTYFLTNNAYCNWTTAGHCTDNLLELTNAKRKMGSCLCDHMEDSLSRKKMVELVLSDEVLKNEFAKLKSSSVAVDSIKLICNNRVTFFMLWHID